MASHGIKDRVAIVGMGCTRFAEHWDKGLDDLIVEASEDTFASAGVTKDDVDAYWFGTAQSGMSGITLARPLQLEGKPVTRVENYCTTGSEALRAAAYAVASGAYDVAMAVGAEKVKDSGYQGLNAFPLPNDGTARTLTAAAMFSMVAPAYGKKYGVGEDELTEVLARISWKNHQNGARNPRAQFRKEVSTETICASPRGGGRHRRPGRGRPPLYRQAAVHQGAVVRRRQRRGPHRSRVRLHLVSRVRPHRRGRLPPGRHHRSAPPAGHGGGARLLHAHRTGADGGPRVRRARHSMEGGAGRHLRSHRRTARQSRRGPQELRPPGGRVGPADVLRDMAAAPQGSHPRAADRHRPDPRPDPQPGRLPG